MGNGGRAVSRLEREERVGIVGKRLAHAMRASEGKKDIVAAIVLGEVEATRAMLGPGWSGLGGIEGDHKLAGGVNGVGSKAKGGTMQTMPG